MKKFIFSILLIFLLSSNLFAVDVADLDNVINTFNPFLPSHWDHIWKESALNGLFLRLDGTNDPTADYVWPTTSLTLTAGNLGVGGHQFLGADAVLSAITILDIDETLTFVDTTGYGIFAELDLIPSGALSAATHLIAMDMQARWSGTVDGSVHASVQGIKGEGINWASTQPVNQLIGVYGKANNLAEQTATEAIGGLFFVANDDASFGEDGDLTTAYSILAIAYTDKDTGVIGTRYGLYIEDTTGGGLLTNQYGLYIEDMASGSASGTTYAIFSLGGNVELTDGDVNTSADYHVSNVGLSDTADGLEGSTLIGYKDSTTLKHILDDIINQGVLDSDGVSDDGGLNISWTGVETYTNGGDIVVIADGNLTCTNSTTNWLIHRTGTTLQLIQIPPLTNDVIVAHISCENDDIWELHNQFLSSDRVKDIQHGLEEFFPVAISPAIGGLAVTNYVDVTSDLDVIMSAGEYYHDLHEEHIVAQINSEDTPLVRWYQDGTGKWVNTTNINIDTAQRNSGTGLENIPANQYVLSAFRTSETQIHWIYSSVDYPNKAQALSAVLDGVLPDNPPGLSIFPWTSFLIYKQGDTDLTTNAIFGILLQNRPDGASGALPSNDHTTLTNLAWSAAGHNDTNFNVDFNADGFVGIGIINPTSRLHVETSTWNVGDDTPLVNITNLDVNEVDSNALLVRGGANNSGAQTFEVKDYTGNTDFVVTGAGQVGIGTDNPGDLLHIQATGADDATIRADGGATEGNAILELIADDAADNADIKRIMSEASTGNLVFDYYDGAFQTGFVMDSAGKVGIGITNPLTILDVNGSIWSRAASFVVKSSDGTTNYGLLSHSSNSGLIYLYDDGTIKTRFWAEANQDNYINNGGNFGLGTASPRSLFDLSALNHPILSLTNTDTDTTTGDITGAIEFYSKETSSNFPAVGAAVKSIVEVANGQYVGMGLFTNLDLANPTEKVRITAGGNVGIGTTGPDAKLHVDLVGNTSYKALELTTNTGTEGGLIWQRNDNKWSIQNLAQAVDIMVFDFTNNRVGIGEISPDYPLHVKSAVEIQAQFESTDAISDILIRDNTNYVRLRNSGGEFLLLTDGDTKTPITTLNGDVKISQDLWVGTDVDVNHAIVFGGDTSNPTIYGMEDYNAIGYLDDEADTVIMKVYQDADWDDLETIALPDTSIGHGIVQAGSDGSMEGGTFSWYDDAPIILAGSANFTTADADNKLVVMDGGATVVVKNQLGDNQVLTMTIWFFIP